MSILLRNIGNKIEAGDKRRKGTMRLRPRGEVVSHVIDTDALCFECGMVKVVCRAMPGKVTRAAYRVDKIKNASPTAP